MQDPLEAKVIASDDGAVPSSAATGEGRPGRRRRVLPDGPLALLLLSLLLGAWLRSIGLDWDANQHLHPDERFLTMVTEKLSLPADVVAYLDTDSSPLNPRNVGHDFYVYGTWPITVAFLVGLATDSSDYFSVYMVGRQLSVLYSLLALLFLFGIGARLFGRRAGGLAALLGALTAFGIQQAHFYTVDVPAMLYSVMFLFFAIPVVGKRGRAAWREAVPAGLALGMGLASKVSLWPLVPAFVIALLVEARRRGGGRGAWIETTLKVFLVGASSFLTLRLCQPDMFAGPRWQQVVADPNRFATVTAGAPDWWRTAARYLPDALEPLVLPDPRWAANMHTISGQVQGYGMDWPPNHQWWGRKDWLYPLRNMVRYGMGWPLGMVAWAGMLWVAWQLFRRRRPELLMPWLFAALMFAINGAQWSKTMRYFLPIYPVLTLFGAALLIEATDRARRLAKDQGPAAPGIGRLVRHGPATLLVVVVAGTGLWGYMFSRIYSRDHSRVAASKWIYHNIPTAIGLTVDPAQGSVPGPLVPVPVQFPGLVFDPAGFDFSVPPNGWLGPVRVQIPAPGPALVTGLQLAHLRLEGRAEVTIEAALGQAPGLAEDGEPQRVVAKGRATLRPAGGQEQTLQLSWKAVSLAATPAARPQPRGLERLLAPLTASEGEAAQQGEDVPATYVWLKVSGAPVTLRPSVFVNQTNWDDFVPHSMYGWAAFDNPGGEAEGFVGLLEVNLYDEDRDPAKLERVLDALSRADYTIATSNRVYGSTRQIPVRYPWTNRLYDALFDEEFGFEHTASIHSFPNIGSWEVNDQPAEEAFHVYDHPQVDLWKVSGVDLAALRATLEPLVQTACWQWPTDKRTFLDRLLWSWMREPEPTGLNSRCD